MRGLYDIGPPSADANRCYHSRFLHVAKDKLAKKYHVRIINPDRPGLGGTTEVDAHRRLEVWLEIVPALLQHLKVSHVTLACQSAGTIYALHTLLHLRHLLRPDRPYVAFCGPWVHPAHSGVTLMALSNALPSAVLKHFDSIAGFVNSKVGPVVGFSSGLLSILSPSWGQGKQPPIAEGADAEMAEFEEKMLPCFINRAYTENISGMGQEVLLLLKKQKAGLSGGDLTWGTWDDVDKFVPMLAALEGEGQASGGSPSTNSSVQLEIEIFFAESDNMIGEAAGPQWLADCWKTECRGSSIGFQSHVVEGTEHDTILNLRFGVMENIFRKMAGTSKDIN